MIIASIRRIVNNKQAVERPGSGRGTAIGDFDPRKAQMTLLAHGFALIDGCYSPSECEHVSLQLTDINSAGTRCLLDYDWCQGLALTLKDRLAHQLPEPFSLVAVQCTYFNKSGTSNWFVGFHQDITLRNRMGAGRITWEETPIRTCRFSAWLTG